MPLTPWNAPGADDSWDAPTLAGKFIPGFVKVRVKRQIVKLDKQKAKGKAKPKQKNTGPDAASVDIDITIGDKENVQTELDMLEELLAIIAPKKLTAEPKPVEIQHPSTAMHGIQNIIIEDIDTEQPDAVDGWHITIKASEWIPEPKAATSVGGAQGGGVGSCASLSAQAHAASNTVAAIEGQIQDLTAAGTDEVLLKERVFALKNAKAKEAALYAALKKCKGTAAPPSKTAQENVL